MPNLKIQMYSFYKSKLCFLLPSNSLTFDRYPENISDAFVTRGSIQSYHLEYVEKKFSVLLELLLERDLISCPFVPWV